MSRTKQPHDLEVGFTVRVPGEPRRAERRAHITTYKSGIVFLMPGQDERWWLTPDQADELARKLLLVATHRRRMDRHTIRTNPDSWEAKVARAHLHLKQPRKKKSS